MTALFHDWLSGKARRATAMPLAPDIMAQDSSASYWCKYQDFRISLKAKMDSGRNARAETRRSDSLRGQAPHEHF